MRKPLLAASMASDTIEEVRGFVEALVSARNTDVTDAILKCLFEDDPMIKGPFFDLSLPYVQAGDYAWPLRKVPKQEFEPYSHQLKAYQRLGTDTPQNTLVTTGTGSGKSECFILPILDYVMRCKLEGKSKGVKALIMYPMNALIDDQADRLGSLVKKLNPLLPEGEKIRVGRYTGQSKDNQDDGKKAIIDNREILCEDPPDILLTNYRMLDFMLFRPEEQKFWGDQTRDVFQFLVLDELHTFDGAQGADVASLIRRLRLKLGGTPFTCVGTSATMAGGADGGKSVRDLCEFATTLFGSTFGPKDVIGQERVRANDFLAKVDKSQKIPTTKPVVIDLMLGGTGVYDKYLAEVCARWNAPVDSAKRGEWIKSHPLTAQILEMEHAGKPLDEVANSLKVNRADLIEFLDLLGSARTKQGDYLRPVMPLQVQLWISESAYLLRKLSGEPTFTRIHIDMEEEEGEFLPAAHCTHCGLAGWFTDRQVYRGDRDTYRLEFNRKVLMQKFWSDQGMLLYPVEPGDQDRSQLFSYQPGTGILQKVKEPTPDGLLLKATFLDTYSAEVGEGTSRKKVAKKDQVDRTKCPVCDQKNSLRLTKISGSMIGSITTGAFLSHGGNPDDKKHLIFNDSVQDAAHQAGYLGARSYRFNIRRLALKLVGSIVEKQGATDFAFEVLSQETHKYVSDLWDRGGKGDRAGLRELFRLVPQDLWDLWHDSEVANPLKVDKYRKELIERITFEAWIEFTQQSGLGWSLKKTDLVSYSAKQDVVQEWARIAENCAMRSQFGDLADSYAFAEGVLDRMIEAGAVYNPMLSQAYRGSKFSLWGFRREHAHLAPLVAGMGRISVVNMESRSGRKRYNSINLTSSGRTWFEQWALDCRQINPDPKVVVKHKPDEFLIKFFEQLIAEDKGIKRIKDGSDQVVLDADILSITTQKPRLLHCDSCKYVKRSYRSEDYEHHPCPQYRCRGELKAEDGYRDQNSRRFVRYLQHHYRRQIESQFAHAHTGGLDAADRHSVERAFKEELYPGDPLGEGPKAGKEVYRDRPINILACTPTLEMGIDIGSLSGITLRGFPRSKANALQRLGRSGRSTGNAFNLVISRRNAHDRHYWDDPSVFFNEDVTAPGCDFRTRDILLRQFHAYLLDCYVGETPGLVLSRLKELKKGVSFAQHPFWQGFAKYLSQVDAPRAASTFLDAVRLGDGAVDENKYRTFRDHLTKTVSQGRLWRAIEEVLTDQDERRRALQEELKQIEDDYEAAKNASEGTDKDYHQKKAQRERRRRLAEHKARDAASSEYSLSMLGGKGILPNYAFQEEGVRLDAVVSIPSQSGKSKNVQRKVSRAAKLGLRELAPGSHFYSDGFKFPVTRVASNQNKDALTTKLICDACGTVTDQPGRTAIADDAQCPICKSYDQNIVPVVEYREVESVGDYAELQIRDAEDEREKSLVSVETFANYVSTSDEDLHQSSHATYISDQKGIAFEFRTNARLNFISRGEKTQDGYELFGLCPECSAVPFRYDAKDKHFVFEQSGINRHAESCAYRYSPNNTNIVANRLAIGRSIRSDTIRFTAGSQEKEFLPTLKAVLKLAMKIRLKGSPDHLSVLHSFLKMANGTQVVATLYDTVPGGTGHLRGLMPLDGDVIDTSGQLKELRELFKETQKILKACSCEKGCYNCLLSYENQYHHEDISKREAILWLGDFISVRDWKVEANCALGAGIVHYDAFASALEHDLLEAFRDKDPGIHGVKLARSTKFLDRDAVEFAMRSGETVRLLHTPNDEVPIPGAIRHTKPDFTVVRNGKRVGYIYADGKEFHLNPSEPVSTFETTDIACRQALLDKLEVGDEAPAPVLTITYNMAQKWRQWMSERQVAEAFEDRAHYAQIEISGQKWSILLAVLGKVFCPALRGKIPDAISDLIANMSTAFIQQGVGWLLGHSESIGDLWDAKKAIEHFNAVGHKTPLESYGGLTPVVDGQSIVFEMDASRTVRCTDDGDIKPEFAESWDLYWMLWHLDRGLVRLVGSQEVVPDKGEDEFAQLLARIGEGWEADLAESLHKEGLTPIHAFDDTVCPDLYDALGVGPALHRPGVYAIFAQESLEMTTAEAQQIKANDKSVVIVVDADELNIPNMVSQIKELAKRSS